MSWKSWAAITAGTAILLTIGMLAALGTFTSGGGKEVRHIAVGQRTITVSHHKSMSQELVADGVKIVADGHVIAASAEAVSIDGEQLDIDPTQDVEIVIDEAGKVEARGVSPASAPAEGAGEAQP